MKKLLYFTRTMALGGTENVVLQLCQFFKDSYEITVISSGGENVKKLQEIGIKHIQIKDITSKNPFSIIKTLRFLKRLIKQNKFDIIHTHHRMAAFFVSMCNVGNAKLIHTMHNSFSDKKKMTEKSLKDFKVVCCGKTVMDDTLKCYDLEKDKVCFITNTINEKPFEKKERNPISPFTFGFFGRFTEQKATDFLVKVFAENNIDANLALYGDGEQKGQILKIINDNHAENRIFLKGVVGNVIQEMQNVDCVILPSRWEGLPLITLEAFYAEKMILVSDIPNNIELVNDKTGLIFKKDDEKDLIEKIEIAMHANHVYYEKQAKEIYLIEYSNAHFYKQYKNIYDN